MRPWVLLDFAAGNGSALRLLRAGTAAFQEARCQEARQHRGAEERHRLAAREAFRVAQDAVEVAVAQRARELLEPARRGMREARRALMLAALHLLGRFAQRAGEVAQAACRRLLLLGELGARGLLRVVPERVACSACHEVTPLCGGIADRASKMRAPQGDGREAAPEMGNPCT